MIQYFFYFKDNNNATPFLFYAKALLSTCYTLVYMVYIMWSSYIMIVWMFQKNSPCRGQISFPYFPGINNFENNFSYHNSFLYRFVELLVTSHFVGSTDSVEIQIVCISYRWKYRWKLVLVEKHIFFLNLVTKITHIYSLITILEVRSQKPVTLGSSQGAGRAVWL